mmetsp:Transcript_63288/g.195966  ORF Transcript_63288/g.195966 Transcript_63288/m.195966 type:complete len:224 (+) Transcript_63288:923-1594(+)
MLGVPLFRMAPSGPASALPTGLLSAGSGAGPGAGSEVGSRADSEAGSGVGSGVGSKAGSEAGSGVGSGIGSGAVSGALSLPNSPSACQTPPVRPPLCVPVRPLACAPLLPLLSCCLSENLSSGLSASLIRSLSKSLRSLTGFVILICIRAPARLPCWQPGVSSASHRSTPWRPPQTPALRESTKSTMMAKMLQTFDCIARGVPGARCLRALVKCKRVPNVITT